jgi:ankyrin repeat protein
MCLVKDLGADPNGADENGCTPMYMAAQEGQEAVVRCLARDLGVDVNGADEKGQTPVFIAASEGKKCCAVPRQNETCSESSPEI